MVQQAVDHHIGITPYGGGKMRIIGEAQSVMPDVHRGIYRLGHGTDGQVLYHVLFLFSPDLIHQVVDRSCDPFLSTGLYAISQAFDKISK